MPPPLGVASVGNAQLCKGDKPCGERSEKRGGPSALFCNSTLPFPSCGRVIERDRLTLLSPLLRGDSSGLTAV